MSMAARPKTKPSRQSSASADAIVGDGLAVVKHRVDQLLADHRSDDRERQRVGAHAPQFGRAFERETMFQRQKDGERATDAKRQAPAASRAAHGALASSGNYMVGHDGFHAQPASC